MISLLRNGRRYAHITTLTQRRTNPYNFTVTLRNGRRYAHITTLTQRRTKVTRSIYLP